MQKAMKRLPLILLVICVAIEVAAQDRLVLRDGTEKKVSVLEVNPSDVKYVRFGTKSPVYTLEKEKIAFVQYADGEKDVFNAVAQASAGAAMWHGPVRVDDKSVEKPDLSAEIKAEEQEPKKWHGPVRVTTEVERPQLAQASAAAKLYEPGDYYEQDGVKGIVVVTTHGGTHGTICSLDQAQLQYCSLPGKQMSQTGATDIAVGENNMKALEQYILSHGENWEMYPAFDWCRKHGAGWYLPALNEVYTMGVSFCGGKRFPVNKKCRQKFNRIITENGGTPLHTMMFYHSSTESGRKECKYSHLGPKPPYTEEGMKSDRLFVRAFRRF